MMTASTSAGDRDRPAPDETTPTIATSTSMSTSISANVLTGRMARMAAQVRPTQGHAFEVNENQFVQITDTAGKQVVAFIAFNQHDHDEMLSTAHTRAANNALFPQVNHGLFSNRHNRMFTIIEDSVGRHDLLFPACDPQRYLDDYGLAEHANCRDNFLLALEKRGAIIAPGRLPDPVNFFMHVGLKARGEFDIREPLSERGDQVLLKANMDCLIAVSACPNDQNAMNAFNPTDVLVRVYV